VADYMEFGEPSSLRGSGRWIAHRGTMSKVGYRAESRAGDED
jgi:hypothetical protein